LTATPASGTAPLSVTFTANVSSGTSPYTYAWEFGDGQTASGSSSQVHSYRNPGNTPYSAKVTVTDSKGKTASDSKSISVSAPPPLSFLEVDVSYSGPGNVDLKLNLNGQSVGTAYPTSCGPTGNRTARVIASQPANGSYTVTATGSTCPGQNSVGPISAVFSALTSVGSVSACSALFKDVPVGSTMTACTFSVP
jgi:PKD repeat protein